MYMGFCCEHSQSLRGRFSTRHPSPQPPVLEALEATVCMGNRELALQAAFTSKPTFFSVSHSLPKVSVSSRRSILLSFWRCLRPSQNRFLPSIHRNKNISGSTKYKEVAPEAENEVTVLFRTERRRIRGGSYVLYLV